MCLIIPNHTLQFLTKKKKKKRKNKKKKNKNKNDIEGSFILRSHDASLHYSQQKERKNAEEETSHLPQLNAHERNLHILSRLVVHTHLKDEVLGVFRHRLLGDKLHKLTHPIVWVSVLFTPGRKIKTHLSP
jgi:hypothetical protein